MIFLQRNSFETMVAFSFSSFHPPWTLLFLFEMRLQKITTRSRSFLYCSHYDMYAPSLRRLETQETGRALGKERFFPNASSLLPIHFLSTAIPFDVRSHLVLFLKGCNWIECLNYFILARSTVRTHIVILLVPTFIPFISVPHRSVERFSTLISVVEVRIKTKQNINYASYYLVRLYRPKVQNITQSAHFGPTYCLMCFYILRLDRIILMNSAWVYNFCVVAF